MEPAHRALLRRNTVLLSGELRVSDSIVPLLFQEEVLTEAQVEHIESAGTETLKTRRLLQLLPSRGRRAFGCFMRSFDDYGWVREALQAELQAELQADAGTGSGAESGAGAGAGPGPGAGAGAGAGAGGGPEAEAGGGASSDPAGIPDSELSRVPSDRELSRLASRLGPEWEPVLMDLGLSAEALFRCRCDHGLSLQGAALAGLVAWRRAQGRRATLGRLLESLRASDVHPSVLRDVLA